MTVNATLANDVKDKRRSDMVSGSIVLSHIAFVILPIFLSAATSPGWQSVLFWVWFGVFANALTLLLHEASHFLVFRRRRLNVLLGRWFLGPLFLTDFDIYRVRHWIHHTSLGEPTDTKETYLERIDGVHSIGLFLRTMLLMEATRGVLRQLTQLGKRSGGEAAPREVPRFALLPLALFQTTLFAAILAVAFAFHPTTADAFEAALWTYGFVYLYGVAGLTVLMANIRAIAEHQIVPGEGKVVGRSALRTMTVNPLTFAIFGTYGFADHAAHHLEPNVPCYNLPAVTTRIAAEDPLLAPKYGYLEVIWRAIKARPTAV